ncbi:GNAT family N-acetyltransferase [Lichenifustis flavocetrariae]|uniref:GNAT family N-acetyltransferase n=1 Tax=Lichenifustis flavocetrariae TaxID=2949735 RepID=A0AA42CIW4_9HYPH|nr:GNAT family N-acetyltransferase [Lichenifustis flavocetrariae]MCW6508943.1 GNAT family N-acetyltransferase [Lichenifustis flavocetrariae]
MREAIRVACLDATEVAAHVQAWADLSRRCLEPSVFNEPGFALPAARFIPSRRRPRFLLAWDESDPVRLIGLCCILEPVPFWPVAAWLHPQATAAFPLLDKVEAPRALAALLDWTRRRPWRLPGFLVQGVPADAETARLFRTLPHWDTMEIERRSRAVLRAGDPLPSPAGKEFRRQARRLAEQGAWIESIGSPETAMGEALDDFLRLEAEGWKGRRGTALVQSACLARFVRSMVLELAVSGSCRIDRLVVDGRPVAAGIVLRSQSRAYFWKTAYDEASARLSPGLHLADAIGRIQLEDREMILTDSCAIPDHAMIDRLWPGRINVVDLLVGQRGGFPPTFRAAGRMERMRRRFRSFGKKLLAAAWRRRPR